MYERNNDMANALKEIIEDFEMEYYNPDPEEGDQRPEVYLQDMFAGARVRVGDKSYSFEEDKVFQKNEYQEFIEYMENINYDSGYGGQNLFGFVLLNDGTWFERYSYDGSEWWVHKMRPELSKSI